MNKPFYGVASITCSQRTKITRNQKVPAPGLYDLNKDRLVKQEQPKWTLHQKLEHGACFEQRNQNPSPNRYNIRSQFNPKKAAKSLAKSEKYKHLGEKTYSHSPLNLPGSFNSKGGFSFGYRECQEVKQLSPGPIYHLDASVEQQRRQKIQNSCRGFGYGQKNNIYQKGYEVGPGSFDVDWKSKTTQSWTFGKQKKSKNLELFDIGPGEYDPQMITNTRSFKIKGKIIEKDKDLQKIGPGAYDSSDLKSNIGPRFNPPHQKRQKQDQYALSPFSYHPPRYLDKISNSIGYTLAKKIEVQSHAVDQPGPGNYEISQTFQNNGGYIGRKIEQKRKESTGDNFYKYDPNFKTVSRQSPKYTFSQSKRENDKKSILRQKWKQNDLELQEKQPQTVLAKAKKAGFSMGTAKRFVQMQKEGVVYKQNQGVYSTIGQMPNYLRHQVKKRA